MSKITFEDGTVLTGELVNFEECSEVEELLEASDMLLALAEEE